MSASTKAQKQTSSSLTTNIERAQGAVKNTGMRYTLFKQACPHQIKQVWLSRVKQPRNATFRAAHCSRYCAAIMELCEEVYSVITRPYNISLPAGMVITLAVLDIIKGPVV